ncbi:uncharacterized protein LACBIDRAFT_332674 [Laccaria bicolor S238N-H82]|uniref:Predicted protein n=1 Tax=Laccaria bicolor (strain S238N-H82 / ATCC MYA-4686) TaxID=486041 RepID=B0DTI0_LACBS|nr:uncharacterized protein LACBIDRAFT_332674 [Laccaria bicolor S238N-H82]EDR02116.1 predicted protein [Laccaria bicolor S238N-H82]|eukprot:XP_001887273.1 predicted protein [Laccaria bicolor S238N-H82]
MMNNNCIIIEATQNDGNMGQHHQTTTMQQQQQQWCNDAQDNSNMVMTQDDNTMTQGKDNDNHDMAMSQNDKIEDDMQHALDSTASRARWKHMTVNGGNGCKGWCQCELCIAEADTRGTRDDHNNSHSSPPQ